MFVTLTGDVLGGVRTSSQQFSGASNIASIFALCSQTLCAARLIRNRRQSGIFSYTPEPHVTFRPIFVHPLFPMLEPHIQKWVILVRRRLCL